ncbi:flagellar basal body P-ring protein FlgI [Arthrobacter sp. OAP107]
MLEATVLTQGTVPIERAVGERFAAGQEVHVTYASEDWTMRRQVMDVIIDVLSAVATGPDVRTSLLRHLEENPGSPERALLAHLSDRNIADDVA